MPVIYLVRHGQTAWNAEYRLQGQIDTPLNDKGRAQAKRNGEVLKGLVSDAGAFDFVASPLSRTTETMEIIRREMGLAEKEYRTDDRLMEINFGEWQGSTWDELRAERPTEIAGRFDNPWNTVAPGAGGESFAMVSDRAIDWYDSVSQDTVVVTHGGINRCLRGLLEGLAKDEIPHLKVPQDKVLKIQDGATSWV
jgi:probable phosphoglycerate mutase